MIRITTKQDGKRREIAAKDGKDAATVVQTTLDKQWFAAFKATEAKS